MGRCRRPFDYFPLRHSSYLGPPPRRGGPSFSRRHIREHCGERGGPMPRSMLYCLRCGGSFPIRRQNNRKRERNHVKTMWCPWCKRVTPHRENRC